jgi:hypothetical protein
MTGPKRNRAPEVAPTRELTRRQMSMESNEKQRQEVIARKAVYDAQKKARKEADAADIKALVSFAKERRIAKEERLAKEARATAFETLVRNAPFTRPELGERSPEPDCPSPMEAKALQEELEAKALQEELEAKALQEELEAGCTTPLLHPRSNAPFSPEDTGSTSWFTPPTPW